MAKLYESVVLIDAMLEDAAIESIVKKGNDFLANGGDVIRVDRWGKRRMAYDIEGRSHAEYVVYYYNVNRKGLVAEFERMLRLDESILRYLTVVDNPAGLPAEPAAEEAVAEEAATTEKEEG